MNEARKVFLTVFLIGSLLTAGRLSAAPQKTGEGDEMRGFGKNVHGLGGVGDIIEDHAKKKMIVFRGYGRHKEAFSSLCRSIGTDGRGEKMYQMIGENTARDADCIACAPFFKTMLTSCKPQRTPKKDPKTGQAIFPQKQRDPHVVTINKASSVFTTLAEEKDIQFETLKAVMRLVDSLNKKEGKSPGEREYFETVAEVARRPFEEVARAKAEKDKLEGTVVFRPPKEVNVDELFE